MDSDDEHIMVVSGKVDENESLELNNGPETDSIKVMMDSPITDAPVQSLENDVIEDAAVLQKSPKENVLEMSEISAETVANSFAKFEVLETLITDAVSQSLENHVKENDVELKTSKDANVIEKSEILTETGTYSFPNFKVLETSIMDAHVIEDAVVLQESKDEHDLESSEMSAEAGNNTFAKFKALEASITDTPLQSLEEDVIENVVVLQESEDEHVPESLEKVAEAGTNSFAKFADLETSITGALSDSLKENVIENVVLREESEDEHVPESLEKVAETDSNNVSNFEVSEASITDAHVIEDVIVLQRSKDEHVPDSSEISAEAGNLLCC